MRIIGGEYRSRLIAMPKGVDIRPTQDKVRGAIFNIIGDVSGKVVLELFAGSGAFGIEALSRGARHATFIDNNARCVETVKANLKSLAVPGERYDVIRANGVSIPARFSRGEGTYDIVFLDPPYHRGLAKKSLINIDSYDIVSQSALVIVEHHKRDPLTAPLDNLVPEDERRYGDTVISIFVTRAYGES